MARCLDCNQELTGRSDKKFCNAYCKSSYHYMKNKESVSSLLTEINRQLKKNRRILKLFNRAGKSTVRKQILVQEGFNSKYHTHTWVNQKGDTYYFCYEYGYLIFKEYGYEKCLLVKWQNYMNEI